MMLQRGYYIHLVKQLDNHCRRIIVNIIFIKWEAYKRDTTRLNENWQNLLNFLLFHVNDNLQCLHLEIYIHYENAENITFIIYFRKIINKNSLVILPSLPITILSFLFLMALQKGRNF